MIASGVSVLQDFASLRKEILAWGVDPALQDPADVFCSLAWFENLASHGVAKGDHERAPPLLLACAMAGNSFFCLPLMDGQGLSSLSNYYSSLYGPMSWHAPGAQAAAGASLSDAMRAICGHLRARRGNWPALTLSPLDIQSPTFEQIATALKDAGYWVDRFFCFGNWYLEVAERSFETYFATLPSPLRHNIQRGQRRLAQQGDWAIRIQQSDPDLLEAAIADFTGVYSKSWKSAEPHPQFIPELARMAAARGWLRLGVLHIAGQAVAAQLWLVKDRKANIFKLAYVEGFERFSPGSVLTAALMAHVIDTDKVAEVDYLTGDDAYKRDWMPSRRERWGLVAFEPRRVRGVWQALRHHAAKHAKKWRPA